MYRSGRSNVLMKISLKGTDLPQIYLDRSASNVQINKFLTFDPIYLSDLSIYLSDLLISVSVHLRPICTFEANFRTYIWGRSESTGRGSPIGHEISQTGPRIWWPICTPLALVESDWPWNLRGQICADLTADWTPLARSIHLRPIHTFEAESVHFWLIFSEIGLKCTAVWLAQRQITWQHKLSLPQMYRKLASNVRNRPQMYGIGLKCTDRPQMYGSVSNVQLSDWLRFVWANQTAVHLRLIRTFEAEFSNFTENLTFDSKSTSDMKYQMC